MRTVPMAGRNSRWTAAIPLRLAQRTRRTQRTVKGRAPVEAEAGRRWAFATANYQPPTNHYSLLTDPAVVVAVLDVAAQGCDADLDFLEDVPVAVAFWAALVQSATVTRALSD